MTLEEAEADWEDSFDDEGFAYLVAEHAGRVVGAAVGCALEKSPGHTGLALADDAAAPGGRPTALPTQAQAHKPSSHPTGPRDTHPAAPTTHPTGPPTTHPTGAPTHL